ncbi:MAG TPA: hypothetical protein PLU30_02780 [Verrucomicrobiae bacterium]|nr:hypothetical protein [Verrucomicrobiae bacterium]
MKNLKTQMALAGALFFSVACLHAQKITVKSGSLDFLKGEKSLNVEYRYANLTVGKDTEQSYTNKKVAEYNAKEAGKGDKWLESWKADRANRFEPKFEELINKQITDQGCSLKVGKDPEAKYTLVLKTIAIEPGWNAAVMRAPASVSTQAQFVETNDRAKELAVVEILKAPGRDVIGYDFDVAYRIQEGYAKTGKALGVYLSKNVLKSNPARSPIPPKSSPARPSARSR